MSKEHPLIEKKCARCGEMMECTTKREVCSVCRRAIERERKQNKKMVGVL